MIKTCDRVDYRGWGIIRLGGESGIYFSVRRCYDALCRVHSEFVLSYSSYRRGFKDGLLLRSGYDLRKDGVTFVGSVSSIFPGQPILFAKDTSFFAWSIPTLDKLPRRFLEWIRDMSRVQDPPKVMQEKREDEIIQTLRELFSKEVRKEFTFNCEAIATDLVERVNVLTAMVKQIEHEVSSIQQQAKALRKLVKGEPDGNKV